MASFVAEVVFKAKFNYCTGEWCLGSFAQRMISNDSLKLVSIFEKPDTLPVDSLCMLDVQDCSVFLVCRASWYTQPRVGKHIWEVLWRILQKKLALAHSVCTRPFLLPS